MRSSVSSLVQSYLEHLENGGGQSPEEFVESQSGDREALPVLHVISDLKSNVAATGGLGNQLGHYRILGELGRGAQGTVHLAEDVRLGRQVALKVLPPQVQADAEYYLRFQREAEAASRLDHPDICTVYEAGIERGFPFIAMRYVEGETLAERIRTQPVASTVPASRSWSGNGSTAREARAEVLERAGLVERVARALHEAHEKGLIHRDVKPGNIMVTKDGEPVLCDFGLVRDEDDNLQSLTRTGDLRGTPAYMSPEQLRGVKHELDRRTDVYSLGLVLYEYLTGRPAVRAESIDQLYTEILNVEPPDPRRFNQAIPPDLKVVLETALDKDPQRRYATARHFAADLRRVRELKPIRARPAGRVLRVRRWCQRHPAKATAIALAALLVVGGPLVFGLQQQSAAARLRAEKDEAERQRSLAEWRAYTANIAAADASLRSHEVGEALRRLGACNEALRGWEWRYLLRKSDSSVATFEVGGRVSSIALARDGKRFAVGQSRGSVQVRDLESGRVLRTLKGHRRFGPDALAFSPDDALLASASWDGTARLWNVKTGESVAVFKDHRSGLRSVVFSPDGRKLVTASADHTIRVWDVASARCDQVIESHTGEVWGLGFLPDGDLVSIAFDGTVRIHDWRRGRTRRTLAAPGGMLKGLAVDPLGALVVVAAEKGSPLVLDARSGATVTVLRERQSGTKGLAFTPDGRSIVTTSADGTVQQWNARTGELVWTQLGHTAGVMGIVIAGTRCLTGGQDGTARLWDLEPRQAAHVLAHTPGSGESIDTHGSLVAWGGWASVIRVFDLATADHVAHLRGHWGRVHELAFSPDGRTLASVSGDGDVRLWSTETWEPGLVLKHGGDAVSVAWAPDGARLASGGPKGTKIWDVRDGRLVHTLKSKGKVKHLSFSPDGDRLAAGLRLGKGILIWRTGPGTLEREIKTRTSPFVAFHPDGHSFVSGGGDRLVRVWDVETGECRMELRGHAGGVACVRYDPAGTRVLSACSDGTMRVWDARTGEMLLILDGHLGHTADARFSEDGARIVSTAFDGTVRVWETELPAGYRAQRAKRAALCDAAHSLVDALFAKHEFSLDVVDKLLEDRELADDVREQALRMARAREERPVQLVDQAWEVVKARGRPPEKYRWALRRVKMAYRIYPNFPHFWTELGAAHYRMGEYKEAQTALQKSMRDPRALPFVVMANHRLGQLHPARPAMKRFEKLMRQPKYSKLQDLIALRDEMRRELAK